MSDSHEAKNGVGNSKLRRAGFGSFAVGILAILACELPLLAAFAGLGGLALIDIPGWLEPLGIGLLAIGIGLIIYWRLRKKRAI